MGKTFKKFKKHNDLFVLLAVILLSALIFFFSTKKNSSNDFFSGPISNALYYTYDIIDYPIKLSSKIYTNYIDLISVKKNNENLKKTISILKYKLNKDEVFHIENKKLKAILNIKNNIMPGKTIIALVTIHNIGSWFQSFYIDKGSKNGINVGDGAVSYNGVTGRVIWVGKNLSKAIPITNPKCAFSVVDAKTGVIGIAEGIGNGYLKMKFVFSSQKINKGDKILTSGLGGVFTAGLLVGYVTSVKSSVYNIFKKITIMPHKNLFNSKYVLIEK